MSLDLVQIPARGVRSEPCTIVGRCVDFKPTLERPHPDFTHLDCAFTRFPLEQFPLALQLYVGRIRYLNDPKTILHVSGWLIGQGSYGSVWVAQYDQIVCAVKFFLNEEDFMKEAMALWKTIGIAQTVSLHGICFHQKFNDNVRRNGIVMDYVNGPTLERVNLSAVERDKKIEFARSVGIQLYKILITFEIPSPNREGPLVHGDVTARNVLLEEPFLKVIDFGSAGVDGRLSSPFITARPNRAPEVILNQTNHWANGNEVVRYSRKVDVWGAAALLFQLVTGQYFNYAESDEYAITAIVARIGLPSAEYLRRVVNSGPYFEITGDVVKLRYGLQETPAFRSLEANVSCPQLLSFFKSVFIWDPDKRPTAAQCFQHPFFSTNQLT
jgi:serine/threonine protein kinase